MIKVKHLAQALYNASQDKTKGELDSLIENFINFLATKRLMSKRGQLLIALDNVRRESENKILTKVLSRHALTRAQLSKIKDYVRQRTKLEPEIIELIDDSIIGGVKIEFGDSVLDTTVNDHLSKLELFIKS